MLARIILPVLLGVPLACAADSKRFVIPEFGKVADGKTINTGSIQKAVDEAAVAGGGIVDIPAGTWRRDSIFLKKGVELHLAENAVLLGSTNIEDYPKRDTRIEGHFEPWRMALVNAEELDGAASAARACWIVTASRSGRSSGSAAGRTRSAPT